MLIKREEWMTAEQNQISFMGIFTGPLPSFYDEAGFYN